MEEKTMGKMKDEAINQDNTMKIWDKVCQTDPDHTKPVEFGRRFTAIDAHYQVESATRLFGPIGAGWGYETEFEQLHTEDGEIIIFCDLRFWWREQGQWEGMATPGNRNQFGPVRGACMMKRKGKAPDTDAPKKAMTDALTKCLSHLGFNADVFLGMFDDNKYVQELKGAKEKEKSAKELAYQQDRAKFIKAIESCKTPDAMDAVLENHKLWMAGLPVTTATEMRSWVLKKKTELEDGSK